MNPPGGNQQGAVMMAYGLSHEKMNCDKLFNILCLYGNIVRVSNFAYFFIKLKAEMGNIHLKKSTLYTIYRYSHIFVQNIRSHRKVVILKLSLDMFPLFKKRGIDEVYCIF